MPHEFPFSPAGDFTMSFRDWLFGPVLHRLANFERLYMTTQTELAQSLNDLGTQLGKVSDETQVLIDTVADLKDALDASKNVSPELKAAFDAVSAQVKKVDDMVPDAPAVEPVPPVDPATPVT